MGVSKETARRIGAVSGLVLGIIVMRFLGYAGILPAGLFGATFCVMGAIAAEQIHDRTPRS